MDNKVEVLIIGRNKGWKDEINIGKVNNQKFVSIPFSLLINMLIYKCKLNNIEVILNEEAHTSKCSFLDLEEIGHKEKYMGRRIKRGLFKTSKGYLINADVNGSYNIMRKVVPGKFKYGIEGVAVSPVRVSISSITKVRFNEDYN